MSAAVPWPRVKLGQVASIQGGVQKQPKRAPRSNAFPFLRVANVLRGRLDLSDIHSIELFPGERGDLLVVEGNGSPTEIGRMAVWNGAIANCVHQNHLIRARLDACLLPEFVAAFWNSPDGAAQVRALASSTSGLHTLSVSKIASLNIPLLSLDAQRRIVAAIDQYLSDIDAGVAALERARANIRRYRASVLKAACEGRLVPTEAELARREKREFEPASKLLARILEERRALWQQAQLAKMAERGQTPRDDRWKAKYEEPDEPNAAELPAIPEGWCWTTLRAIADIKGGVTKGQRRRADERVRLVPYRRVANVQRGFLDLTEVKDIEATDEEIEELRLVRGDVLFNEGGDRDKLGRGWVWEEQLPLCIHQNHVFRARVPTDLVEPKFLSWYGNSFGQRYFLDEGKQTTNLASINMTKLGALPVPVPPGRGAATNRRRSRPPALHRR